MTLRSYTMRSLADKITIILKVYIFINNDWKIICTMICAGFTCLCDVNMCVCMHLCDVNMCVCMCLCDVNMCVCMRLCDVNVCVCMCLCDVNMCVHASVMWTCVCACVSVMWTCVCACVSVMWTCVCACVSVMWTCVCTCISVMWTCVCMRLCDVNMCVHASVMWTCVCACVSVMWTCVCACVSVMWTCVCACVNKHVFPSKTLGMLYTSSTRVSLGLLVILPQGHPLHHMVEDRSPFSNGCWSVYLNICDPANRLFLVFVGWTGKDGSPSPTLVPLLKNLIMVAVSFPPLSTSSLGLGGTTI